MKTAEQFKEILARYYQRDEKTKAEYESFIIEKSEASVRKLFGNYYNKKDAPVILLRDSCRGTPHHAITNLQIGRKSRSYFEERNNLKIDLKNLNVNEMIRDNYLKETDDYFYSIYNRKIERQC